MKERIRLPEHQKSANSRLKFDDLKGGGYENFLMDREWARKKNWEGQSGRLNIPSQKIFAAPAAFLISLQNKYIQQTHSIIILIKMRMFRAT